MDRGYGALDVLFAALYGVLGLFVAPSRSALFNGSLMVVAGLLGLAGLALLLRWPVGRRLGIVACVALLVFSVVVLALLVASSAFLYGVYGPLGRGMALLSLVIAALVVELFALLPLFQLRALLRHRG
jgi:hypothetical protein